MPQITLITLYAALFPLAVAVLPVGTLIAVPRVDDPSTADIFVSWVPTADDGTDAPDDGTDAPDPADSSGWRARVEAALANAPDLLTLIGWLKDASNGITRDMSVEILDPEFLDLAPRTLGTRPDSPASLTSWLDAQALGVLGDHCALQAEVEHLAMA